MLCSALRERLTPIVQRWYENATLKYRTRSARIKFWWTRAAPVAFCIGAAAEWYKWTYQEKYRTFRLEGGGALRPSAWEMEMYQNYLEKHGTAVMDSEYNKSQTQTQTSTATATEIDENDPDVQLVIDTINKENT